MKVTKRPRLCVVVTNLQRVYDLVNSLAYKYETHVIYVAYPITSKYIGNFSRLFRSYPVKYPYKSGSLAEAGNLRSITFVPLLIDMFMKIRYIVRENDIDLIHAHWAIPSAFLAALAGGRIPLITTMRGSDIKVQGQRRMLRPFINYALRKSAKIIALSNDLKQEAVGLGALADKINVIPGGVDINKFKPLDKRETRESLRLPEGFIILFVGNLIKVKRVDRLIKVSARLSRDFNFHLIIVGDGSQRTQLANLATDLGLKNILFLGTVSYDNVPFYMAASDVLVLPSESEGLPDSVQQAMACSIPIVASNVGGLPELITNGVNGFVFDSDSEMEACLRLLLTSPELAETMGRNGVQIARGNLSIDKVIKQTEDLYNSVLD